MTDKKEQESEDLNGIEISEYCPYCGGCGEGSAEGTRCKPCKGTGEI